jgi:hypothetical protein
MQAAVLAMLLSASVFPPHHYPPEVVFAASGERVETSKADALAIGWSMLRPYRNVTISVRADSGHDDYTVVTAYLMTRIGPLTHPTAEIARTSYELPPSFDGSWVLFENLDLPAGEYWLVFERPPHAEHGEPEWRILSLKGFTLGMGNRFLGTRAYSYVNHRTEYLPDATYTETRALQGYAVTISGVPEY